MNKNFKLKGDNYIDAKSIMHKSKKLSELIDESWKYNGEVPTDWNDAKTFGVYYVSGSGYENAVATGGIYGILIVYESKGGTWTPQPDGGSWIWQEFRDTAGNTYKRYAVNDENGWSAWERAVSIVEYGSNANGFYEKHSDGKLLCYGKHYRTIDITGEHESSCFGVTHIDFAASFVENPTISLTLEQNGSLLGTTVSNMNANGADIYIWKTQSKSNVSIAVDYIAIGRWK